MSKNKNTLIAEHADTIKDRQGNERFVHVAIGEESAEVTQGVNEVSFDRGTKGYAAALKWVTERLGK